MAYQFELKNISKLWKVCLVDGQKPQALLFKKFLCFFGFC